MYTCFMLSSSDSDYSAADPLEVTFVSGSAVQDSTSCAQINILDDTNLEGPHSFTVEITTVELDSDGTDPLLIIGPNNSATVNIVDNDGMPPSSHYPMEMWGRFVLDGYV